MYKSYIIIIFVVYLYSLILIYSPEATIAATVKTVNCLHFQKIMELKMIFSPETNKLKFNSRLSKSSPL